MDVDNVDKFISYAVLLGENAVVGVDCLLKELYAYVDNALPLNISIYNARFCLGVML